MLDIAYLWTDTERELTRALHLHWLLNAEPCKEASELPSVLASSGQLENSPPQPGPLLLSDPAACGSPAGLTTANLPDWADLQNALQADPALVY